MGSLEMGSLNTVYGVSLAVNRADGIQSILCSIVQNVAKETRAKGCCLALLTPDRRYLRHMACYGISDRYITKGRISVDKSIAEALEGKPIAIFDATRDDRIQYPQKAREEDIASILCVPVMLRDEILGVMRVYTAEPRTFTDHDVYFVSVAANIGAKALEDAVGADGCGDFDPDAFRRQLVELEWGRWPAAGQCP